MANITGNSEKSKSKRSGSLPFADYLHAVKKNDSACYNALIAEIKNATCIRWDYTISRYENGVSRPGELHRRIIAEVIARHSGKTDWTGDQLFPAELYRK
ncbi:MAG: hypothetical protein K2I32_03480 [Alistipes sp.]|nr:hypothetical protein [Alistipes sp.]